MTDGRIITVFAAKNGCGKTMLATNLAAVLHDRDGSRVCLFDLDLEYGDLARALWLTPARSLSDALPYGAELDTHRIASVMTPLRPGLDCLLAPPGPGESARIPASLVSRALTLLPRLYDFVVVDTAGGFSAHLLAALDLTDHLVLVTTPDRPALYNLRITLDVLDLLPYDRGTRDIVVNRSDRAVELPAADLEAMVRNPVTGYLPARGDVPASINRGVPLAAAQPDHAFSRAIRDLADVLVPADGKCSRDPPPG
jgi:pilus assembly protein CpaE